MKKRYERKAEEFIENISNILIELGICKCKKGKHNFKGAYEIPDEANGDYTFGEGKCPASFYNIQYISYFTECLDVLFGLKRKISLPMELHKDSVRLYRGTGGTPYAGGGSSSVRGRESSIESFFEPFGPVNGFLMHDYIFAFTKNFKNFKIGISKDDNKIDPISENDLSKFCSKNLLNKLKEIERMKIPDAIRVFLKLNYSRYLGSMQSYPGFFDIKSEKE